MTIMTNDINQSFLKRCASDILNGLSDGITHFSGPSRAAVLFALGPQSPLMLCDPQNLLKGHEPVFKALYIDNEKWRYKVSVVPDKSRFAEIHPAKDLGLAGLLSHGGYSSSVFYQHWFTEHQPDLCSTGPILCWLEHAVWRFSHDMANESDLYTGISGNFLREYATHSVRDYIVDQLNVHLGWDTMIRIYPVLNAVLRISETREEGGWAEGQLLFVDPSMLRHLNFLVTFQEDSCPRLANSKHVRKLLQSVEDSSSRLVSDGHSILGISDSTLPPFSICADFQGRHGFLKIQNNKICSFADGRFGSTTYQDKLVHLEELLLESSLGEFECYYLFKIAVSLVHHAQLRKHGCTLVLDLNSAPVHISGQRLSPPLGLRRPHTLNLAKSLAKVDGALHIGADRHLHGFACLLDGRAFAGEDLARGARYNSALRFTAENENIIVVVVSSDRPVSVIHQGVEVQGACDVSFLENSVYPLERLDYWVGL